jgi:hypothetical protein
MKTGNKTKVEEVVMVLGWNSGGMKWRELVGADLS